MDIVSGINRLSARTFVDDGGWTEQPRETSKLSDIGGKTPKEQRAMRLKQSDDLRRIDRQNRPLFGGLNQDLRTAGLRQGNFRHYAIWIATKSVASYRVGRWP
ncbi:hypothetical protein ASG11_01085 [Sphingomonas sp. Leaf357]|nr:hypothetical protein ASG11_01085 [Sphingomonas sp. Leaf357]